MMGLAYGQVHGLTCPSLIRVDISGKTQPQKRNYLSTTNLVLSVRQ